MDVPAMLGAVRVHVAVDGQQSMQLAPEVLLFRVASRDTMVEKGLLRHAHHSCKLMMPVNTGAAGVPGTTDAWRTVLGLAYFEAAIIGNI